MIRPRLGRFRRLMAIRPLQCERVVVLLLSRMVFSRSFRSQFVRRGRRAKGFRLENNPLVRATLLRPTVIFCLAGILAHPFGGVQSAVDVLTR